jgi:hypothetical protein
MKIVSAAALILSMSLLQACNEESKQTTDNEEV